MLATTVLGAGRPLVVLPSYTTDAAVSALAFEPALGLSPAPRRVYVDLPGCGRSTERPADSEGVLAEVELVVAAEAERAGRAALLAGWSYGAYLAGLARRRPDLVAGLLLVCPGVRALPSDRDRPPDLRPAPARGTDGVSTPGYGAPGGTNGSPTGGP